MSADFSVFNAGFVVSIAFGKLMLLNEIFDTKPEVSWRMSQSGSIGKFELEDHVYELHLDEYTLNLSKTFDVVDFGFTRDGKWQVTNDSQNSAAIFGAIINSVTPKFKELSPDIILFGMHNKNGAVESRESLYDKLAKWYCRGSMYDIVCDWISTTNGKYKMLSKVEISDDDLNKLKELAASIPEKQ